MDSFSTKQKIISGTLGSLLLIGIVVAINYTKSVVSPETTALLLPDKTVLPYTDLQGTPISFKQYLGEGLIVATWASWSPYSATDLAMLEEIALKYQVDRVTVVALNRSESIDQASRFLLTQPAFQKLVVALDPSDHFYKTIGGYAMPELVVFAPDGQIVEHYRGVVKTEVLQETLNNLLGK